MPSHRTPSPGLWCGAALIALTLSVAPGPARSAPGEFPAAGALPAPAVPAAADTSAAPHAGTAFVSRADPHYFFDHGHHHGGLTRPVAFLAAGAVAAAIALDEESPDAARRLFERRGFDSFADFGNVYGDGLIIGSLSLGVLAAGRLGHDDRLGAIGGDLCESFLTTSASVWAVKLAVDRTRPSGGQHSFPSGHTAVAFCVVPVLGHHLGWRGGAAAAVLAATTGIGRMEERRHYLSDVLAGAALGLACGDIVAGSGFLPGRARPVVLPRGMGVSVPF